MKRVLTTILLICLAGGCAAPAQAPTPSAVAGTDRVPIPAAGDQAGRPVVARGANSITMLPISAGGAVVGVDYAYDMPHCGINGPIDVDGSFWDAMNIDPESVDFDGKTGTFRLTAAGSARFTRMDGATLTLERHVGAKEFRICS